MSDEPQRTGQDLLNEIMDRAMPSDPAGPSPDVSRETEPGAPGGTEQEAPSESAPPDSAEDSAGVPADSKPAKKNKHASVYLYLLILFGAAFLMLLLAYFVQQRNNEATISGLQDSWNLSREELVEENQKLTEEKAKLEAQVAQLQDQADKAEQENEAYYQDLIDVQLRLEEERVRTRAVSSLWYLSRFMEARDYPMAAAAMYFSADSYAGNLYKENPALWEQFHGYQQELIDRGYLELVPHPEEAAPTDSSIPTSLVFTEQWDPSQNHDMAAMSILWCALEGHFLNKNDNAASQYLFLYPLGDPATGYQERVERMASSFTLEQFQLMKDALVEDKWLAIAEDGAMSEDFGPTGGRNDLLYTLPFTPPPSPLD